MASTKSSTRPARLSRSDLAAYDAFLAAAIQGLTTHHGSGELPNDNIAEELDYDDLPFELQQRLDVMGGSVAFRAHQIARAALALRQHATRRTA